MGSRIVFLSDEAFLDKLSTRDGRVYHRSLKRERLYSQIMKATKTMLTEKQRLCFLMYFSEGKHMTQIAAELGVNISTVSRHIKAARKKLSKLEFLL